MILNYNNAIDNSFRISIVDIPQLDLYAQSTSVPTSTLNAIEVNWQDVRSKVPDNKYLWDDLVITFVMDEDLYVYELLRDWHKDIRNLEKWQDGLHDINVIPLSSSKSIEYSIKMTGAWPTMISGWQYTTTNSASTYITFDVAFAYQDLTIDRLRPLDFRIVKP